MPATKKAAEKKPATKTAAPKAVKAVPAKQPATKKAKVDSKANPKAVAGGKKAAPEKKKKLNQHQRIRLLIQRPAKSFRIGQDLPPSGVDLTRLVKWPKYIRMQRQKQILLKRLKMPPPLNHFNHSLDKTTAQQLFKLLMKYRPEEGRAKQKRLREAAVLIHRAKKLDKAAKKRTALREVLAQVAAKKPMCLKRGLNHVTGLVEKGKAQLVVIAHDVDPIELVVWLPALCRKKHIPYCIVKGKSRLGFLSHMKTCAAVAITNVRKEDRAELDSVIDVCKSQFNDNAHLLREWSTPKFGLKHRQAEAKRLRLIEKAGVIKTIA